MRKDSEKPIRYTAEIKREAVRLFLEEGIPFKDILARFGISTKAVLSGWVRKYREGERNFSSGHRQKHKTYPPELKLEAARLHEEDGLSYNEILVKLEINSKSKLKDWVYRYRLGERNFLDNRGRSSTRRTSDELGTTEESMKTNQQLEAKIRRLEMENALLKKAWAESRR